jgi:hypothetical protein
MASPNLTQKNPLFDQPRFLRFLKITPPPIPIKSYHFKMDSFAIALTPYIYAQTTPNH